MSSSSTWWANVDQAVSTQLRDRRRYRGHLEVTHVRRADPSHHGGRARVLESRYPDQVEAFIRQGPHPPF